MRKRIFRIPVFLTVTVLVLLIECLPIMAAQGSGPYTSNNGTVFYMPVVDKTRILYDYEDLLSE